VVSKAPVRNVVILGSTGSIGRQALDVVAAHPARFKVVGLVAGRNERALVGQAAATGAPHTGLGADAAADLAALPEADVVLNAIVGAAGLRASIAALEAGKQLALASKESLVAGGELCLAAARRGGGTIVPVDSEHAAISVCLAGRRPDSVHRLVLTASGGPFLRHDDLSAVTPREALAHPTWSMGPKITVDCATLMNKGLEVIEAHHLFGFAYDEIGIVLHPQSIVHGIVELIDGSTLMHAAPTDMRIPIQAALTHADVIQGPWGNIDLGKMQSLDFEPVNVNRWRCVGLAYEAGRAGGSFPAVLNAANEVAVHAFLAGTLGFEDIPAVVAETLEFHDGAEAADLDALETVDAWARSEARRAVDSRRKAAVT
jgi:1-deoxy-D-xylulose-5-phosphate reductoisomerase